jgi:hypothetical protein
VGREVWGTYSVRDHLQEHPRAADVLLQFGVSEAFAAHEPTQPSPAGLLITARKELGWQ